MAIPTPSRRFTDMHSSDIMARGPAYRPYLVPGLTLGLAAAFLVYAHHRVLTYVCGNDPMLYIRAARVLLRPGEYGHAELIHALTFVAPGYPALLAGAIAGFGDLAPYWVNLVLLLLALPLMWRVFRGLMGTERAAACSLLGWLLIVFRGHEINAACLLYPFRETAVWLLTCGAAALLLSAARRGWRGMRLAGGGLLSLAACAFREPAVLILPGLALGLGVLAPAWRTRLRAWAWFLLPWVVAALAALVVVQRFRFAGTQQMGALRYLLDFGVARDRALVMAGWIPAQAGWLGAALMALGAARALRRAPVLLAWFLLPAALYFVFYAFMQLHARYFLTSMMFAAALAGYGLDGLLAGLERLVVPPAWRVRVARAATGACLLAAAILLGRVAGRLQPWGPDVSADQVRQWQETVRALAPGAGGRVRIAVEQRCRYLEDLLRSYTDAELLDPKDRAGWPADWAPAHYFKPLNRAAEYAAPQWLMYLKVYAHRIMAHHANVTPEEGDTLPPLLGEGRFQHYLVTPWQPGAYEQSFALQPGEDHVLWLDWGAADPGATKCITVADAGTGQAWFRRDVNGAGLQAILLPGDRITGVQGLLTVESTNPIPAQPLQFVTPAAQAAPFDLGTDRLLSLNGLFPDLGADTIEERTTRMSAGFPIAFAAPVLHADVPALWRVAFQHNNRNILPLYMLCLRAYAGPAIRTLPQGPNTWGILLQGGERMTVRLATAQYPPPTDWMRLLRLTLQAQRAAP